MKKPAKITLIVLLVLAIAVGGGGALLYFNGLSGIRSYSEPADGQIKVACVGDSITYGHGISDWPENNYPAVLQDILGGEYCVNNYGVSGYCVQESADRPYSSLKHYRESVAFDADYLVFMMGSNDSKPENWQDADTFKADLTALLDSYGNAKLILCTPASAFFLEGQTEGVTNFDIQPLVVDEIAQTVRDVAAERGCVLVDIHLLTSGHAEWFTADGVHPSNECAAAIAEAIAWVIASEDS